MGVRLAILLFTTILLNSAFGYDRFFPARFEIYPRGGRFPHSTFLRTLSEDSGSYQAKIDSSNVTSDIITTRLKGDTELGYYYITLFFGTPLQKQTLIVDTGSVTTTIPCVECGANCGTHHFNKPFDHQVSESFKTFGCMEKFGNYQCSDCTNECSFSVSYVEGSSYNGHFKKDYVALGNEIEDLFDILLNKTTFQSNGRLLEEATSSSNSSESTTEPAAAAVDNSENNQNSSEGSGDSQNAEISQTADQKQDNPADASSSGSVAENPGNTSSPTANSENTTQSQNQDTSTNSTSLENSSGMPGPANEEPSENSTNTTETTDPINSPNPEPSNNSTNPESEPKTTDSNETNSSGKVVEDNSSNNTLISQESVQNTTSNNSETTTNSTNSVNTANSTNTSNAQNSENNTSSESSKNTTETEPNTSSSNSTTPTEAEASKDAETPENKTDTTKNNTEPSTPKELTEDEKSYQKKKELVEGVVSKTKTFIPFGCTERETKLFFDQEADGILGLGVTTDGSGRPPNLLDIMHSNNPSIKNAFSLCLAQSGGYFTTGGYNFAYHEDKEKIYHTDYYDNYGQYRVYLNRIEVAGKNIGLSADTLNHGEGAFFDSGTTLTHVPSQTYNAIKSGLYDYCSQNSGRCGRRVLTEAFCYIYDPNVHPTLDEFLKSFPTFTFYFGNQGDAKYEWKGEDYLARKGEGGKYCMGISRYERESILGGTFMKNHDLMFDKENKKIAFVRAQCDAIVDVTSPIYLYSTKADQTKPEETPTTAVEESKSLPNIETTPAEGFDQENGDTTKGDSTSGVSLAWSQMKKYVIFVVVGAAVGIIIFASVKCLRKRKYDNMRNEIEIADHRAVGLSFESNNGNLPSPHDKPEGGIAGTINSLVEVSI